MYKRRRTHPPTYPTCMCATWNLTSVYTTSFGKSELDVGQGMFLFASRPLTYAHGWPPALRFTSAKVFRTRGLFLYTVRASPRNRSTGDDERSRGHAWLAGQRLIVPAACEAFLLSPVSRQMTRYTRGRVIEEGKIDPYRRRSVSFARCCLFFSFSPQRIYRARVSRSHICF